MHYGVITEQSRKAKSARAVYEAVRSRVRGPIVPLGQVAGFTVTSGFRVPESERARILSLGLHDEHMSPYFKTDMNLFQLLMLDESIDMSMYKTQEGVLFVFEGLPTSPQPFGAQGHDPR